MVVKHDTKKHLESCEMWFFKKNDEKREMLIRQLEFMGHITRKEGLENLALTGKIVGRRSRGRRS